MKEVLFGVAIGFVITSLLAFGFINAFVEQTKEAVELAEEATDIARDAVYALEECEKGI